MFRKTKIKKFKVFCKIIINLSIIKLKKISSSSLHVRTEILGMFLTY